LDESVCFQHFVIALNFQVFVLRHHPVLPDPVHAPLFLSEMACINPRLFFGGEGISVHSCRVLKNMPDWRSGPKSREACLAK
jgi:hypothetical protein